MVSIIGKEIDNYRILEIIGQGGMGVVYKALHVPLKRPVAIKMIHPMLTADQAFARRFRKEAQALAKLDHKHIVTVLDFRETEFGWMIIMNYIEGITLADKIAKEGILPLKETLNIMKQALSGIAHAHSCGFIHHDIKPRNLMISSDGTVRLTDFGLVRADRSKSGDTTILEFTSATTTAKGGTIYYMSAEQIRDPSSVDIRTDIYSIGITFYEMLTGRRPFEDSDSDYEIQTRIIQDRFPPPLRFNPGIPKDLSKIVMKAIQKDREQRYKNAAEMFAAIRQFEGSQRSIQTSPSSPEVQRAAPAGGLASVKEDASRLVRSISGFGKSIWVSIKEQLAALPLKSFASRFRKIVAKYKIAILGALVLIAAIAFFLPREPAPAPESGVEASQANAKVSISVMPAEARVWIDGNETSAPNLTDLELESGWHRIYASHEGFAALSDSFEVLAGNNPLLTFELPPSNIVVETGQIKIHSDPPGALVYMDGTRYGRTPATIPGVEVGRHRIGLILKGYEDFSQYVRVQKDQTLDMGAVAMVPVVTSGELRVKADPSGASIYLDGVLAGVSDGTVLILPAVGAGQHTIKITKEGFKTVEQTITIEAGKPRGLVTRLEQVPAELNLKVNPGATVFIDDKAQAQEFNDQYALKLAPGAYKLSIKHPALGTWERNIHIKAGQQPVNLKIDFNEQATLVVLPEGDCKSGEVLVDGKPAGFARTEIKVRIGLRTVEVRSEGCKSAEGSITRNFDSAKDKVTLTFMMKKE